MAKKKEVVEPSLDRTKALLMIGQMGFVLTDRPSQRERRSLPGVCGGVQNQRYNKNHCCVCVDKPSRLYPPLWTWFVSLI